MAARLPPRGYLVCCIERTGSNLLSEALFHTGVAGQPQEYYSPVLQNSPTMPHLYRDSTLLGGFEKILEAGMTPNGVFGAKLHWAHLRYLAKVLSSPSHEAPTVEPGAYLKFLAQLPVLIPAAELLELLRKRAGDRSDIEAAFALFTARVPDLRLIWLRRQNMVARAISHYRALKSRVWSRLKSAAGSEPADEATPEFDLGLIHQLYVLGLFQEESWQWLFDRLGATPHRVTYEELAASYEPTVRGVLQFLDLEASVQSIPPTNLVRQADAISEEWERRYRELSEEKGL